MRIAVAALLAISAIQPLHAQQEPAPMEMLEALNVAVAYIQYCGIEIPHEAAVRTAAAGTMLELGLGLTREEADARFSVLKEVVVADPPDCDPAGPDLAPVLQAIGAAP